MLRLATAATTDKSKFLKLFNALFGEFVQFIARVQVDVDPTSSSRAALAGAIDSFDLLKRANPTIVIKVWHTYVYTPYKDVIESRNLDFITEKNYASDLHMFENVREILAIIDTLRDPIRSMNEEDKDAAMTHLSNLTKLCVLYHAS